MKLNLLFLVLLLGFISCEKEEDDVSKVVINELMAMNSYSAMDQNNQFDDWIELYNNTGAAINLTGYYLSDSKNNLTKWKFPEGTSIESKSFLVVWADADTLQAGLHTNFKLSSSGEKIYLATPQLEIWDKVEYGEQTSELSYARTPNGTGEFKWTAPTFNSKN